MTGIWCPHHKGPVTQGIYVLFVDYLKKADENGVELPTIWDAMTRIWRHRYEKPTETQ